MSKLHRDNAGYVGCSYEETQDPYYSYNKLALPLSEKFTTVERSKQTFVVTQVNGKYVIDGVSQANLVFEEGGVYTFDLSDSTVATHPFRIKKNPTVLSNSLTNGLPSGYSAITSSQYSGTVSNIETDDTNELYATNNNIDFDLGAVKTIHSFIAKFRSNSDDAYSADYRIELHSGTAFNSSTLLAVSPTLVSENTTDIQTIDHDFGGVSARYVRWKYTGGGRTSYLRYFYPYTSSVDVTLTTAGTQGQAGATAKYVVPFGSGDLAYYCNSHSGMGGNISTPLKEGMSTGGLSTLATTGADGGTPPYTVVGGFNSGSGPELIFDGNTSTQANGSGSATSTFTITFNPTVTVSQSLEIYIQQGNSKFTVNGGTQSSVISSGSWTSLGFTGSLQTLEVQGDSGANQAPRLGGIRVDGVDLTFAELDPFASYLKVALPMYGTNNGDTFIDVSHAIRGDSSSKTFTKSGDPVTSTSQSIFYGASGSFDGSGDYLTSSATGSDMTVGDGPFTIEFWVYLNALSGSPIFVSAGTGGFSVGINSDGNVFMYRNGAGGWGATLANSGVSAQQWTHIACVIQKGSIGRWDIFVDGKRKGSLTGWSNEGSTSPLYIGGYGNGVGSQLPNGYLSDIRIYKGVAKYLADFVIADSIDGTDLSGNNNNASNAGATWQTSVKKFYDGATYFNGSSYLAVPSTNGSLDIGGGDFTIEMWFYDATPTSVVDYTSLLASQNYGDGGAGGLAFSIYINTNHTGIHIFDDTGPSGNYTSRVSTAGNFSRNQWAHFAWSRKGSSNIVYINGSQVAAFSASTNYADHGLYVGANNYAQASGAPQYPHQGYIQDLKIYKGIAKYTSSFSPPERSVQGTARRYPSGIYVVS